MRLFLLFSIDTYLGHCTKLGKSKVQNLEIIIWGFQYMYTYLRIWNDLKKSKIEYNDYLTPVFSLVSSSCFYTFYCSSFFAEIWTTECSPCLLFPDRIFVKSFYQPKNQNLFFWIFVLTSGQNQCSEDLNRDRRCFSNRGN